MFIMLIIMIFSFVDISLPVQYCVEDSRLILWEGGKDSLPGVWDPVPGTQG